MKLRDETTGIQWCRSRQLIWCASPPVSSFSTLPTFFLPKCCGLSSTSLDDLRLTSFVRYCESSTSGFSELFKNPLAFHRPRSESLRAWLPAKCSKRTACSGIRIALEVCSVQCLAMTLSFLVYSSHPRSHRISKDFHRTLIKSTPLSNKNFMLFKELSHIKSTDSIYNSDIVGGGQAK